MNQSISDAGGLRLADAQWNDLASSGGGIISLREVLNMSS